jgi:hypothetical protein
MPKSDRISRKRKGGILLGGAMSAAEIAKADKKANRILRDLEKQVEIAKEHNADIKELKQEFRREIKQISRVSPVARAPRRAVRRSPEITTYRGLKFKNCNKKLHPDTCPEGIRPYRPRMNVSEAQRAAQARFKEGAAAVKELMDESRDAKGKPTMSRAQAWALYKTGEGPGEFEDIGTGYMY